MHHFKKHWSKDLQNEVNSNVEQLVYISIQVFSHPLIEEFSFETDTKKFTVCRYNYPSNKPNLPDQKL
jgi:hypothetical protein